MGYKVIAPVGDNLKALFVGIKEFPTDAVFLITPDTYLEEAKKLEKKLDEFTIKTKIYQIKGNALEEMFKIFGEICSIYPHDEIIVNVATGDRITTCAALSASYANGLKAFGIMDDHAMLMPIMKLSYYNELSENKMKILEQLDAKKYITLKSLSEKLKISLSLLSYHINGNFKHKGLKEFRLITVKEDSNNVSVKLSELGNLLLKGYIKQGESKK